MNPVSIVLSSIAVAALLSTGCGEVATFDCAQICNNYSTCIDSSLDNTACINQCESRGDTEASFENAADACESCLDGKACAQQTSCNASCGPVVRAST